MSNDAMQALETVVDVERYRLDSPDFVQSCRTTLRSEGALVLPSFLRDQATEAVRAEGIAHRHAAYFCTQSHNVYLTEPDPDYENTHPRNRTVSSSKGCICDDTVPSESALRTLYDSPVFRGFLCAVLDEPALYSYADPLSSINIHYANEGQELGWHFDNSAFATTLLIQSPDTGGEFEYVPDARNAASGEMGFDCVRQVLDAEIIPHQLTIGTGALVLFRGRNALHRVTPSYGEHERMLVVLAYNSAPDISLSESARMTFYGRLD